MGIKNWSQLEMNPRPLGYEAATGPQPLPGTVLVSDVPSVSFLSPHDLFPNAKCALLDSCE